MGFGGPLLGLFACKTKFLRRLPGRIVGQTTDADGKRAFVMTLRTREQDIRRERATSNICTNEALYALAASVYLATMGKQGLRQVAELCLQKSHYAAAEIAKLDGYALAFPDRPFFKEFVIQTPRDPDILNEKLLAQGIIGGLSLTAHYRPSATPCSSASPSSGHGKRSTPSSPLSRAARNGKFCENELFIESIAMTDQSTILEPLLFEISEPGRIAVELPGLRCARAVAGRSAARRTRCATTSHCRNSPSRK